MIFKQIPQYKDYEISESGVVRNIKTKQVLKPRKDNGYLNISLYTSDKKYKCHNIHRLVALAWLEVPKNHNDLQVAHNDGNRENNHYSNLRWATAKENIKDKYKHNSFNARYGENHPNHKLNDELVIELRQELKTEDTDCQELSKKYQIPKLTIYDAVTGRSWKHIDKIESPVNLAGTQFKRNFPREKIKKRKKDE